ncbi:MAG: hypothetical protein DWQ34_02555 [Planctomycetota bacterium]|nr:MAG: hypothetical protein DWQ29_18355 [Planctomycetota bacterium]REJ97224.1 MAG: hypothetical protein DWQ34_02555 [Planctomycetota bacterium]REK30326.1 MAG: hypothetical protein DWQ41_02205 [Planctomycetota bacterium]REK31523.1 MAG: hypothetical protein DWQ45_19555 [Planctomycetota bacterium]
MELENQILDLSGFTNYPIRLLRDYIALMFESSPIKVRSLKPEDFEDAKRVEAEAWGDQYIQFDRDQFEERIEKFPLGNICAIKEGRMVGLINMQRVHYDWDNPWPTWYEATNNGRLRHDPDGEYLYGVNLSIAQNELLSGAGNLIMLRIGLLMMELGLRGIILGVRPLRYHRFADKMSFDEYLYDKRGKIRDPELGMYCRMGFEIRKALPEYFEDPESVNYGVLLFSENPHFDPNKPVVETPVGTRELAVVS